MKRSFSPFPLGFFPLCLLAGLGVLNSCGPTKSLEADLARLDGEIATLRLEAAGWQHRLDLARKEIGGFPADTRGAGALKRLQREKDEAEAEVRQRQKELDRLSARLTESGTKLNIYTNTYLKP